LVEQGGFDLKSRQATRFCDTVVFSLQIKITNIHQIKIKTKKRKQQQQQRTS